MNKTYEIYELGKGSLHNFTQTTLTFVASCDTPEEAEEFIEDLPRDKKYTILVVYC